MSPVSKDIFTYVFLIWMYFISLSWIIFSSGLPELLNRNKCEHLYLTWDLCGKSFQFFPVEDDVIVGFSYMTCIIWGSFLVSLLCLVFLLWKNECFLCICWDNHMTSVLHSIVISHLMIFICWIILTSQR